MPANGQGSQAQGRTAWYDPATDPMLSGGVGVEGVGGPRSPLSPVVSPRGERRSRFLGPILAALLLVLVVGGAAYAVDRARNDDDPPNSAAATSTARTLAAAGSPESTATTAAGDDVAPTGTTAPETAAENTTSPTETAASSEAVSPTEAAGETASGATEPAATKRATRTPTSTGGTVRAADVLPAASDLPDGFAVTREGTLKKADVAAVLGEGGEDSLTEWKWRENAFREYTAEGVARDATFFLSVSVHRLANRASAEAFMDALANVLGQTEGYEAVDVKKIGDESRALTASSEEANIYALYVRDGTFVYRLGGSSISGDPAADVIALAEQLVGD